MTRGDNGLELSAVKTETRNYKKLEFADYDSFKLQVKDHFGQSSGFCVLYLDYKVLIGKYENGIFIFYNNESFKSKYIQKMRLFNELQELYIWRKHNGEFAGRFRTDEKGSETDVIDAWQILWGTQVNHLGDFCEIHEERGTRLVLPLKDISVDSENRIFIKTRNYISYMDNGQAGYEDCRFVAFTDKNGDSLEE